MAHPRGDVRIKINGEQKTLRLTLGALADIEDSLGGGNFEGLKARLANPRVSDLILILHALLAGGGNLLTLEALKASDIDLTEAANVIARCFEALGNDAPGKPSSGEAMQSGGNGSVSP